MRVLFLDRLAELLSPERVTVVSYDALQQRNSTVLAFLVCNASAGLEGQAYTACEQDMSSVEHGLPRLRVSPRTFDIDVARLSRQVYLAVCQKAFEGRVSVAEQAYTVGPVASALPSTCDHAPGERREASLLERISDEFDAAFLRRAGARLLPVIGLARADKICFVDEIRLRPHHLALLKTLTPSCDVTRD